MKISTGLFDHMVLQRDRRNQSDALITGHTTGTGTVQARIGKTGRWRKIGQAAGGIFSARLRGLPVGGPYRIELAVGVDRCTVADVLVGDVWICAGQSNMQGVGRLIHADKPQSKVRAFYMNDRWAVARDPIHCLWDCVDQVHLDLSGGVRPAENKVQGAGPAIGFGQEMQRQTGIPQGLIACGHGGTSMAQWDPAKKRNGSKSLYGATIRRLEKNGGRVAGVIWYQGEAETTFPAGPEQHTQGMRALARAFRRDAHHPQLPIVVVQIARVVADADWVSHQRWNAVQDRQRRLPELIRQLAVVPAIDLPMDDLIHIGGPGVTRLGRRMAQAMRSLTGRERPPLEIRSLQVVTDKISATENIVIEVGNVMGRLVSTGRPTGFTVVTDRPVQCIFDVVLEGNRIILRTNIPVGNLVNELVHYGYGVDPYCNITDEADRALPVFGPLPLASTRAVTPFATKVRVTPPVPGDLQLPVDTAKLPWQPRQFPTNFCDVHLELGRLAPQELVVYFTCDIDVPEPMRLAALLGYDGPVQLWIDGRAVFQDPRGSNPAPLDKAAVKFTAQPGKHQVLVALGSNQCKAWGIFLRFERLDIPRRLLQQGPTAYRMPILVG